MGEVFAYDALPLAGLSYVQRWVAGGRRRRKWKGGRKTHKQTVA